MLSELIQALLDNPEQLDTLPSILEKARELEESERSNQERITKLQEVNRSLLSQIPVDEPDPEPEDEEPTLEDAKQYLIEALKGDN